jgi:gas vesicle protein
MMTDAGFWFGMGAGAAVGLTAGVLLAANRNPMRTQVGKGIQKMGTAVDHTVDSLLSSLR